MATLKCGDRCAFCPRPAPDKFAMTACNGDPNDTASWRREILPLCPHCDALIREAEDKRRAHPSDAPVRDEAARGEAGAGHSRHRRRAGHRDGCRERGVTGYGERIAVISQVPSLSVMSKVDR